MKTTIGDFNSETKQVPVKFEHNGVTHERPVNAVLNDKGKYDHAATQARVTEVGNGVKVKIEIGVIKNPPETPAAPSEPGPVPPQTPAE